MSRGRPMEYRWEEANPATDHRLNELAQEGWEVLDGIVVGANRTFYVMLERVYEEPVPEPPADEVLERWEDGKPRQTRKVDPETGETWIELSLPSLRPDWKEAIDKTVADHAAGMFKLVEEDGKVELPDLPPPLKPRVHLTEEDDDL